MRRPFLILIAVFLGVCEGVLAQAVPTATRGPADLRYAIRYSQDAQVGGSLGNWQTVSPSGEVEYENGSSLHPLSFDYSCGYTHTLKGISNFDGVFQRFVISQGANWKKWHLQASDDVSYRPQAPITGFSGIPGIGEPIGISTPPTSTSQSILTLNTHVVGNSVMGNVSHLINFATSINFDGNYDLLRFPDDNGIDTNTKSLGGGLQFRINGRNSIQTKYLFYQFTYPSYKTTFRANSGTLGFERSWTRALSSRISAGPSWIAASSTSPLSSSLELTASANVDYHLRSNSASLVYSREATGGSGYLLGSRNDSFQAVLTRSIGRNLTLGFDGGYRHESGLVAKTVVSNQFGGAQVSRRLGRSLSSFANYTAVNQSTTNPLGSNVLNTQMHLASFGISYTRETQPSH